MRVITIALLIGILAACGGDDGGGDSVSDDGPSAKCELTVPYLVSFVELEGNCGP
jgi:hypothetical protein